MSVPAALGTGAEGKPPGGGGGPGGGGMLPDGGSGGGGGAEEDVPPDCISLIACAASTPCGFHCTPFG
jgi:hypothetical protein